MSKIALILLIVFLFLVTSFNQTKIITPADSTAQIQQIVLDSAVQEIKYVEQRQDTIKSKLAIIKALLSKDRKLTSIQNDQIKRIMTK